jgi:hypothetical protein
LAQDVSRISKEAVLDMQQIREQFQDCLSKFRDLLVSNQKTHLHFLALRLDFNEYYSRIESAKEDLIYKAKDPARFLRTDDNSS